MIVIGLWLGGLFLILRDLIPYVRAQRSGVVHTTGYSRKPVHRSEEPGRFAGLCRHRMDGVVVGLMVIGMGIAWFFFGLFALLLILPIGGVMTMRAKRSRKSAQRVSEEFS